MGALVEHAIRTYTSEFYRPHSASKVKYLFFLLEFVQNKECSIHVRQNLNIAEKADHPSANETKNAAES